MDLLTASDLPPAQLYIVLGVVTTACAAVAGKIKDEPSPGAGHALLVVALWISAVLAVVPILGGLWEEAVSAFDALGKTRTEVSELTLARKQVPGRMAETITAATAKLKTILLHGLAVALPVGLVPLWFMSAAGRRTGLARRIRDQRAGAAR